MDDGKDIAPEPGSDQAAVAVDGGRTAPPASPLHRSAPAIIAAVVLIALVGAAFAAEKVLTPKPTEQGGYAVVVIRSGKVLRRFTLKDLHKMPVMTIEADGQHQTGPPVLRVLASAGATDYTTLLIRGLGIRDGGEATVLRSQLASAVLDFADKRDTVKFVASAVATRVRDVTSLEVR
jgi:hypothetical protein